MVTPAPVVALDRDLSASARPRLSPIGLWGVIGVVALLVHAILRLAPLAIEPIAAGMLGGVHLIALAGWIAVAAYAEGYRAFHKQFAPRVVARAQHLAASPRLVHALFAPAFCMGLFHATRKRLVVSWSVVVGVTALVVAMEHVAQPWRGIIDAGVVIALAWGVAALGYFVVRGVAGHPMPVPADLPAASSRPHP